MTRAAEVVGAETDPELAGRKGLKKLCSCLVVFSLYFTHNTDAKNRGDWIQRHTINRGVWTFSSFASLCWCSCLILVFVSFSWHVLVFFHLVLVVLFLIFCFSFLLHFVTVVFLVCCHFRFVVFSQQENSGWVFCVLRCMLLFIKTLQSSPGCCSFLCLLHGCLFWACCVSKASDGHFFQLWSFTINSSEQSSTSAKPQSAQISRAPGALHTTLSSVRFHSCENLKPVWAAGHRVAVTVGGGLTSPPLNWSYLQMLSNHIKLLWAKEKFDF